MTAPSDRRRQILEAAQQVFLERGYSGAAIGDIRTLSGASTGSIYHFFPGKAAIAAALFAEAVAGWGAATRAAQSGDGAEAEIRASVEGLVDWGLRRPDQFRMLDELRLQAKADTELAAMLDAGAQAAQAAYEARATAGEVRAMPWPVARALMLGPAYEYLRMAAGGRAQLSAAEVRRRLSDAAWAAVAA